MKPAKSGSRFCIVTCSPGPVAAALFKREGDNVTCLKSWTGGSRPGWLRGASLNLPTLVMDRSLPTLVTNPRQGGKTHRSSASPSLSESGRNFEATLHERSVRNLFELALEERIVADAVTSFTTLEAAAFSREFSEGNGARLSVHGASAVLVSRISEKISARFFLLPGGQKELDTTLKLLPPCPLHVDGLCTDPESGWQAPEQLHASDSRLSDRAGCETAWLESAARLWAAGELPAFRTGGRRAHNTILRWAGPLELALGMLCIALAPALLHASADLSRESEAYGRSQRTLAESSSRAHENAGTMERIETLSRRAHDMASNAEESLRCLSSLLAIQDGLESGAAIQPDEVRSEENGRIISIRGTFPKGRERELNRLVEAMERRGFGQIRDAAMQETDGRIAFTIRMRRAE